MIIPVLAGLGLGYLLFTPKGQEYGKRFNNSINKMCENCLHSISKKVSKPKSEQVVVEPTNIEESSDSL